MSNDEFWRHPGMKMCIRVSSPKWDYGSQYIMKEVNILSCEEIYYRIQTQEDLMRNLRILSSGLYYLYDICKFYLLGTQLFHLQKEFVVINIIHIC